MTLAAQSIVTELARDTTLSTRQASKVADTIMRARWDRRPRTYGQYVAAARHRQTGAGFASPLLAVTDEQLARADADIGWRLDHDGRATAKATRDAEFGAAPFRLTGYGLEPIP
ncbi:MAG: hypothetical protein ABI810_09620 [Sphingomonas bacterium]